jgi:hypothetical protein
MPKQKLAEPPAQLYDALKRAAKVVLPDIVLDTVTVSRLYRSAHGRLPNILFPTRFTEKVVCRSLFDRRPILKTFADKYAVRSFVESVLGKDVLPELYWVTQTPADIVFSGLPDRFVIKPTHGSGWVRIVRNKAEISIPEVIAECEGWLSQDFYMKSRERIYKGAPRRIMIEELVDDGSKGSPTDYKMFVFHGRVRLIQVIRGRFAEIGVYHFDRDWNVLAFNFDYDPFPGSVPPPPHLQEMIAAAETLGRDMDFVRADFYDTSHKFYFGELTCTPSAGLERFVPDSFDEYFGALWPDR